MKQVIQISTVYGIVGWIVYTGGSDLFRYRVYSTKKEAEAHK